MPQSDLKEPDGMKSAEGNLLPELPIGWKFVYLHGPNSLGAYCIRIRNVRKTEIGGYGSSPRAAMLLALDAVKAAKGDA